MSALRSESCHIKAASSSDASKWLNLRPRGWQAYSPANTLGPRRSAVVISCGIVAEPFSRLVIVLVDKVGPEGEAAHLGPKIVEMLAVGRRTRRTHYLDFGVCLTKRFNKGFEALHVFGTVRCLWQGI